MRKWFLLLAATVLLAATGTAQQKTKVACVGNSITTGVGAQDRANDAYPAVLGRLLGDRYEVRNFGASGYTLLKKGDRPFWNHKYFQESQAFAPDIVVIKLGTNDSKPQNWDTHAADFKADLTELVAVYQKLPSKPKIYLCFPTWVANDKMTIREKVIAAEIIPIISEVANETGASVIDLHKTLYGMPGLVPDGVHPNELGYVLIAKDVYDRIK